MLDKIDIDTFIKNASLFIQSHLLIFRLHKTSIGQRLDSFEVGDDLWNRVASKDSSVNNIDTASNIRGLKIRERN